jgi:glucoamylase
MATQRKRSTKKPTGSGSTGEAKPAARRQRPQGPAGTSPQWATGAKDAVGTAAGFMSHVWFSLSHGILNEVYFPRIDIACVRDLGMIVTDGVSYFSEEKRDARHEIETPHEGIPLYRVTNICPQGRYRIEKTIFTDPDDHALLQETRFEALAGPLEELHLYALLAPRLGNRADGATAWVGDFKGVPMLFAQREGYALALACSVPWLRATVDPVGRSDGWHDLTRHKHLTRLHDRVENNVVALMGEVDLARSEGRFLLALGFGQTPAAAAYRSLASLREDPDTLRQAYIHAWRGWHGSLVPLKDPKQGGRDLYPTSASVLRCHETKTVRGGIIASLSVPWGTSRGDDTLGGYHLVWSRDLVESAGGLLAAGATEDVERRLIYLHNIQEADGHWAQNLWVDGAPHWSGLQLDETALPILLVSLLEREEGFRDEVRARFWPMVRAAAGYLVRKGPSTQQDRWEREGGYTPFTLATEIAALLAAAELADANREPEMASFLRETADAWNARIERWLYVTGTELARRHGVEGYYMRIVAPESAENPSPDKGQMKVHHLPPGKQDHRAVDLVSPDVLALVRFGLRAADDPRIVNTVKVIDATLRVDTPAGPCWHRYTDDGYGEHDDGSPFDGTGTGRAWPLLTGERAHYELAAGRRGEAVRLLRAMESFANESGMIPEQVWDSADIPDRGLYRGRPTGSAMPLAWAHSEYIKLRRSLQDGRIFDMPPQTVDRYLVRKVESPLVIWRFDRPVHAIEAGQTLRLVTNDPARVRWSLDGWETTHDTSTRDTGLGVHFADLPTAGRSSRGAVEFTFYWPAPGRWEDTNFRVRLAPGAGLPDESRNRT